MTSTDDPSAFVPLKPVWFHILLTLAQGPCHGYAIRGVVEERTEGRVRLWPTTLYGALSDLSDAGLIEESDDASAADDALGRVSYRLTALGAAALEAEAARLESLVHAVRAARPA